MKTRLDAPKELRDGDTNFVFYNLRQRYCRTLKFINIKPSILGTVLTLLLLNGSNSYADSSTSPVRQIGEGAKPAIATDASGNISVAFEHHDTGKLGSDIMVIRSSDGGSTWSSPVKVSMECANSSSPDIAIDSEGTIDVVWSGSAGAEKDQDIFFARSTDNGKTWSPIKDIANTPGVSAEPRISVGPDNKVHVVWSDTSKGESNTDIFYSYSADGKKWGRDELLPADDISNTSGASTEPAIAVSPDAVPHVAWLDTTSGKSRPDIFYTCFVNGVWTKALNVSNSPKRSAHPAIACGAKKKVYLSWSDNSRKEFAQDIWCAISSRTGKFEKPINISGTTGVSSEPAMSAQNEMLAVVWTDTTKNEKAPDIWGRLSNNFGSAFTNATDLGNTPGISSHPDVSINGKTLYVVWQEREGVVNNLNFMKMNIKSIATGFIEEVDPVLHGHNAN